jgi:Berberine and berberine like/FAD binding domain
LGSVTTALFNSGERAIAHGSCPDVGIGGHATIGGVGPTSRQWGATIDHVVSATVVLADGHIATVSETENSDLLWALKGAGFSYFVVTEFVFKTEAAPAGGVSYTYAFEGLNATTQAQVFKDFQAFISNPDLSWELYIMMVGLPEVLEITGAFFGSLDDFDALGLEQAFSITPVANVTVIPNWLDMVAIWATESETAEEPAYFYAKSLDILPDALLSDDTIDSMFDYLTTTPDDALTYELEVQLVSGAMAEIASNATAFPHRDVLYWIFAYAATNGTVSETTIDFLDGFNNVIYDAFPNDTFYAYAGYVDPLLTNGPELYWADNLPRLEEIKKKWDPSDVFHNPQTVPVGDDSVGECSY